MQDEESDFPIELTKGVWHSTSSERYNKISESKYIKPEPDIPDEERCTNSSSFVRSLGGVSLFDFRHFNLAEYNHKYDLAIWATFVPCRSGWDETIWLELDEEKMNTAYLSPNEVMLKLSIAKAGQQIVPEIEAAHIGVIPISFIKRALRYSDMLGEFVEIHE
ncbi:MAG: hypothetical protein ACJAZP_001981 [Psychromonas sp.]|jgi:hypothetical protein|uniref:hypothetical protein n=1 Tax=Psychromonas sp. TaxID=1884585 RepID=UPI0039E2E691